MAGNKKIKSAIESMLFVWGEPLNVNDIADLFNVDQSEISECCRALKDAYEQEGRRNGIRDVTT